VLDHFGFTHMPNHFVLVGYDEVGLLDLDAVNVLLMLSFVESSQVAIFNSFVFVIQACILE
jgi:hypothetical protein